MKDWKTTILGICGAFIAVITLIVTVVEGKPVDLTTVTNIVNQLIFALGLGAAADSMKPPTP